MPATSTMFSSALEASTTTTLLNLRSSYSWPSSTSSIFTFIEGGFHADEDPSIDKERLTFDVLFEFLSKLIKNNQAWNTLEFFISKRR